MGNQINYIFDMNRMLRTDHEVAWQWTFIFSGLFFTESNYFDD